MLRDATRNALLVGGKEIAEIVYSSSTNELQTKTVNYNGVDYEVYESVNIVASPRAFKTARGQRWRMDP